MTDPDQFDQLIRRRLAAYTRQTSGDVTAPGAQDVYRVVKHRQQRRTALVTIACIAVVALLLGTVVTMRRDASVPITVPPSSSPSASLSASRSPSPSPSPSAGPSSPTPPASSKTPSKPPVVPPAAAGPSRRSFPVVDGSELHVVALDRVTLRPVGDHYEGTVNVDVYNSGRQGEDYNNVYITVPVGAQEQSSGPLEIGGCGIPDPPETWVCNGKAVSAMGGYARTAFTVTVGVAPGSSTRTVPGFAVRFVAVGQQNTVLTDVTPADNKAVVTLVLPPA